MKVICIKPVENFKLFRIYFFESFLQKMENKDGKKYIRKQYVNYKFGRQTNRFYFTEKEFSEHFEILNGSSFEKPRRYAEDLMRTRENNQKKLENM